MSEVIHGWPVQRSESEARLTVNNVAAPTPRVGTNVEG